MQDLGIIVTDAPMGKSQAAVVVTSAIASLNQKLNQATAGSVDLRLKMRVMDSLVGEGGKTLKSGFEAPLLEGEGFGVRSLAFT
jgi:hypothetical protein